MGRPECLGWVSSLCSHGRDGFSRSAGMPTTRTPRVSRPRRTPSGPGKRRPPPDGAPTRSSRAWKHSSGGDPGVSQHGSPRFGGFGQCSLPVAPSRMKPDKEIKMTTARNHWCIHRWTQHQSDGTPISRICMRVILNGTAISGPILASPIQADGDARRAANKAALLLPPGLCAGFLARRSARVSDGASTLALL